MTSLKEEPRTISQQSAIQYPAGSLSQLLSTKLYRPPTSPDLEQRTRLLERLNRNRQRPLTLISAPAGYGKTILASQWLETCDLASAWLSLDESDNDLGVFVSYLIAAISSIFPDLALRSVSLMAVPNLPSITVLAQTLINDLDQIHEPFILVLDDIHRIHQQEICDLLDILLQHPPRNLHLAMIGRHDPHLQISSLRAHNQVTEVRTLDLCFTPDETARLMRKMLKREVDPAIAADWTDATEGWVTALRLAALSLRHRGQDDDLSLHVRGDSRYLRDYLFAEVLSHLPANYQNYLVKIALLDRFCGPLCEAICQTDPTLELNDPAGETFIDWLECENLFLIPLDDQHRWFRFHHLFQELLLDMLQKQSSEDEMAALRRRASHWFADNGLIDEALQYALDAGDTSGAVELVAQHRYQLINAEHWNHLTKWIGLFPENVVDNDPILAITKAHLPSSYGSELARILSFIHQLVADLPDASSTARAVKGEIAYFGSMWAAMSGPPAVVIEQGNDALMLLPQEAKRFRSGVLGLRAIGYQMSGDYKRGVNLLNKTLDDPSWSANARSIIMITQSYMCLMEGDLKAIPQYASGAVKIALKIRIWHTLSEGYYLLGISHYLRNELDLAEPHLQVLVDQRELYDPVHLAQGVCALMRLYRAKGQPDKATEVFDLAFSYLEEIENKFAMDVLRAFQVELALDEGDLALAHRLSQSVDFDMDRVIWYHFTIQLVPIKIWLAEGTAGSLEQALTSLEKLSKQLLELNRKTQHIEVMALHALVCSAQGDEPAALENLCAALELGVIGGNIRSFADLGPRMKRLLLRLREQGRAGEYAEYIEKILAAFPKTQPPQARILQSQLDQVLTEREYEVLFYLAQRFSNKEIAEQLVISLPTAKSHTLNIYKKLGVNNRKQAVEKAIELDLLPKD